MAEARELLKETQAWVTFNNPTKERGLTAQEWELIKVLPMRQAVEPKVLQAV